MRFRQPANSHSNLARSIAPLLVILFAFPSANAELQNVQVGSELRAGHNYFSQHDVMIAHCVWGLVDRDGNVIHAPSYAGVGEFSEGLAAVTMDPTWSHPRKWGFANKTGAVVIDMQFLGAGTFSEGLAAVCTEAGWGYIDRVGDWVISPQYEFAQPFSSGRAIVHFDGIPRIIERNGNVEVLPEYDAAWDINDGLVCVRKDDRYGFANLQGDLVIPLEFESVRQFYDGAAPVEQQGAWGLIDTQGKFIVEPSYEQMHGYPGGIFCVTLSGLAGVIDSNGKTIIPIQYGERIPGISPHFTLIDGLLQFYGPSFTERLFFNLAGELELELSDSPYFDSQHANDVSWHIGFFQEGRAQIEVHEKDGVSNREFGLYGFIDKQGEVVIAPIYAGVRRFSDGVAWVAVPRPAEWVK